MRKNLSYEHVNASIDQEQSPFIDYHNFALILQKHRRGLNLETDEVRLEVGGQMAIKTKSSSNATKLIETFMVAANETIAEIIQAKELPVIYRNHPLPDKENVQRFNAQAKVLGFDYQIELPKISKNDEPEESILDILSSGKTGDLGGNISFTLGAGTDFAEKMKEQIVTETKENLETKLGVPIAKGLAQLSEEDQEKFLKPFRDFLEKIENLEDKDLQKLGYLIVLRLLSRALYTAGNFGHFGLGSTSYLHFTSPIRRYPDIITHRVCKAMIAEQEINYTAEEIEELALHCTEQSEIAEKLERTIIGSGFSLLTRNPTYTENRQGMVASIAGGGIFVLLPNAIEARIALSKMTGRPTFVDEYGSMCFIGFKSVDNLAEEVTPDNWRELLEGEEEPVEIIAKLGDKIAVDFVSWDHIEGKVGAIPISFGSD